MHAIGVGQRLDHAHGAVLDDGGAHDVGRRVATRHRPACRASDPSPAAIAHSATNRSVGSAPCRMLPVFEP